MAKLKNKLSYLLALVVPTFVSIETLGQDTPKTAGSEEEAAKASSGGLSVGAIAAAVAAAAAIAAASDSDSSSPAPTPAPTIIEEYVIETSEEVDTSYTVATQTAAIGTVVSGIATATRSQTDGPDGTGDTIYIIETVEVKDVINTDGQGNTSTGTATSTATATSTVASNDYRFDVNSYFGPEVGANAPIDVSVQEAYSVETIVEVPIMVPWDEPFKQTTVVTGTATATRTADGPSD